MHKGSIRNAHVDKALKSKLGIKTKGDKARNGRYGQDNERDKREHDGKVTLVRPKEGQEKVTSLVKKNAKGKEFT